MSQKVPTSQEIVESIRLSHGGMFTDPAEKLLLDIGGRVAVLACRHLRGYLESALAQPRKTTSAADVDGRATWLYSVLFFGFHQEYNLIIPWIVFDSSSDDPIVSNPLSVSVLRLGSRRVPDSTGASLSRIFRPIDVDIKVIYVKPYREAYYLSDGLWKTLETDPFLDGGLKTRLGILDRIILPWKKCEGIYRGAFMIAFNQNVNGMKAELVRETLVEQLVSAYYNIDKRTSEALEPLTVIHPIWSTSWEASRESRTHLPHQASFQRVVSRLVCPSYWSPRTSCLGLFHFDFNDFKRMNSEYGYQRADRIIELFVYHITDKLKRLGQWMHPVSTEDRVWAEKGADTVSATSAWYLSRIGGDEFGLTYLSDETMQGKAKSAIASALRLASDDVALEFKLIARPLYAMGAHQEVTLSSEDSVSPINVEELASGLWSFLTHLSQEVKVDLKFTCSEKDPFQSFDLKDAVQLWSSKRALKIDDNTTGQPSYFTVPFVQLPTYLDQLPFLRCVSIAGVDQVSRLVLCGLKDLNSFKDSIRVRPVTDESLTQLTDGGSA